MPRKRSGGILGSSECHVNAALLLSLDLGIFRALAFTDRRVISPSPPITDDNRSDPTLSPSTLAGNDPFTCIRLIQYVAPSFDRNP